MTRQSDPAAAPGEDAAVTTVHSAPLVLPVSSAPIEDGAVAVSAGRIVAVGTRRQVLGAAPGPSERRWDGLLTPGLVNAHTHLNYTCCEGFYGNGKPFGEWILDFPPVIAAMTPAGWAASARDGVARMLATGTTAAADVVTGAAALGAQRERGLAGVSYLEAVFLDGPAWGQVRAGFLAHLDAADRVGAVGAAPVGISPHTLYTLSTGVLRDLAAIARERGVRLHPHAAETVHEEEFVASGTGRFADWIADSGLRAELLGCGSGRTPVAELDALGLLGPDCHVAHGIHVSAADRALLRDRGTVVALCPRSNARLASGAPPVAAYRAEGNVVGAGTDSLASSPDLDLLAELAALRTLALSQGSPEAGLDRWLVEAATLSGAAALGRADLGRLEVGARADLAVFAVLPEGPGGGAGPEPYAALVHGAGSCVATVVAGVEVPVPA